MTTQFDDVVKDANICARECHMAMCAYFHSDCPNSQ